MSNPKTVEKYYRFLVTIYNMCQATDDISIPAMAKSFALNAGVRAIMVDHGLIKFEDKKTKWVAKAPTKEMAEELLAFSNNRDKSNRQPQVTPTVDLKPLLKKVDDLELCLQVLVEEQIKTNELLSKIEEQFRFQPKPLSGEVKISPVKP